MPTDSLIAWQVVLVCSSLWSGWVRGREIVRGRYHPLNVVTVVHAWFSLASVLMEWIWGIPNYRIYTHLIAVNDSQATWLAYYIFSSALCIVFAICASYYDRQEPQRHDQVNGGVRFRATGRDRILLWLGLISPVFCALFTPDSRIWTKYAALLNLQPNADHIAFVNALYSATYVALLSACGLVLAASTRVAQLLPIGLFAFAAVWLNGKRNSVILALVLTLFSLRIRGLISRRTTYVLFLFAVGAFGGYSQWYQSHYRPILSSFDTFYETARMDFIRDADVRMALFAELEEAATPILEYRGQSMLFDALFFVPRAIWEEKPKPYYFYITPIAIDGPRVYRSWGIETTVLGETIANFGLVGLALGPLLVMTIAVVGYRRDNPFLNLFTCIICTLFMSIQLAGFTVLWAAWCILIAASVFSRAKVRARHIVRVPRWST